MNRKKELNQKIQYKRVKMNNKRSQLQAQASKRDKLRVLEQLCNGNYQNYATITNNRSSVIGSCEQNCKRMEEASRKQHNCKDKMKTSVNKVINVLESTQLIVNGLESNIQSLQTSINRLQWEVKVCE